MSCLLLVLSSQGRLAEESAALERFVWNQVSRSLPSQVLPPMESTGVGGWTVESLESGRPYVVNFFATWCKPCEE